MFEEMLEGWARQQRARRLSPSMVAGRERVVRRFQESTGTWPWRWRPEEVERWVSSHAWAHSTVRNYEGALAAFMGYLTDDRYGWAEVCRRRVGAVPAQICTTTTPPCTSASTRAIPAVAPSAVRSYRRSSTPPTIGWGGSWRRAARAPWLRSVTPPCSRSPTPGGSGAGRRPCWTWATSGRTRPPRARALRGLPCPLGQGDAGQPASAAGSVHAHALVAEALAQYIEEVRPLYEASGAELWPTERGGRISARQVDERFASFRRAAGLPAELSVHCLRHSYISHCIEDGTDPLLVQQQAGHSWASTTAVYTTVGSDYKQRMVRAALERAFGHGSLKPKPEKPKGGLR